MIKLASSLYRIVSLTAMSLTISSTVLANNRLIAAEEGSPFNSSVPIFRDLPAPQSADDAISSEVVRRQRLISWFNRLPLPKHPTPPKIGYQEFLTGAASRLTSGADIESLNSAILNTDFKPWKIGTDIAILGPICKRKADYDFVLITLVQLAYMNEKTRRLSPQAEQKLKTVLLSHKGKEIYSKFTLNNCPPIKITDTENHILMAATAQFLTNQLLAEADSNPDYDNQKNGLSVWLLNHLQTFTKSDFSEFNSRGYQAHTWIALSTLHEHSRDPAVKTMAQIVLDYISVKFAFQSSGLRRQAPFRRRLPHYNDPDLTSGDRLVDLFTLYFGHRTVLTSDLKREPFFTAFFPYFAALHSYRPPLVAYRIMFDREYGFSQKFSHSDPELFYKTPDYLVSAGGRFRNMADAGNGMNDALAVNSTIMFHEKKSVLTDLFRFEGTNSNKSRNNTCLYKNVICGFNFSAPQNFPAQCKVSQNNDWEFFDLKSCGMGPYYVAARIQHVQHSKFKNFGVIEISRANQSFSDYRHITLKRNSGLTIHPKGQSSFVSSANDKVEFDLSAPLTSWVITAINGNAVQRDFRKWPLAQGSAMNSSGGLTQVTYKENQLTLDTRNPLNPSRREK